MDIVLIKILRQAVEFLEQQGYRYAVIGGLALPHWGSSRYTHDIDIKVLIPDTDYSSAQQTILSKFPDRARLTAKREPLILAVTIEGIIVDFLFTIPGYDEHIIDRAVLHDMDGWSLWVCTAEDLIIQKVFAGREKDWLDVESLLIAQHERLDYPYIADWLGQFAEALEDPGIIARYQALRDKINRLAS